MKLRIPFIAFIALLLTGGNVWAGNFSSLYTFGDSLSDIGDNPAAAMSIFKSLGGNCDPFHPCSPIGPYDNGRFTNGPVATEYLAAALFPGGVTEAKFHSYAVGGATSGIGNYGDGGSAMEEGGGGIFPLPGMQGELKVFRDDLDDAGGKADSNALYFVWGGANDYLTGDDPKLAAQNIAGYVNELAGVGATHFLVPNIGDLGRTPSAITGNDVTNAHNFSLAFNTELTTQLGSVSSHFPGIDIVQFDTYSFLNNIIQNPGSFGFTDVQDSCLGGSLGLSPCGDPGSFLFWDSFHPTTKADSFLGAAFASAVPEPEMVMMYMMGLLVVGLAGSRRRKLAQA
jgi:phospholipase/lecithinase/hemolysin